MKKKYTWCNCKGGGIGFALIVLIIGIIWLARDMGWIDTNVSLWPILLIVLGVYWILKKLLFHMTI